MSYSIKDSVKVEDGKTFIRNQRMRDIADGWDGGYAEELDIDESELATIVEKEFCEVTRWSIRYRMIFKLNDKLYSSYFSEGATEMQHEAPYEFEGEWIEVTEVFPKEETVTVTRYVTK